MINAHRANRQMERFLNNNSDPSKQNQEEDEIITTLVYDNKNETVKCYSRTQYYKKIREFKDKKQKAMQEMEGHRKQVKGLEEKMRDLRIEIDNSRPRTENGVITCDCSDITSMKYMGENKKEISNYKHKYECELCGTQRVVRFSPENKPKIIYT